MTQVTDKEDDQWLNALAGRPDPATDSVVNQQAEALRRVLQAQRAKLEDSVPQADDTQYQQLLFRLKREGLLKANRPWHNPMLWGLAATLVLGVGVVLQMGGIYPGQDDADTLRGGGKATVLVVDNPEVRLVELLSGLKAAGVEPVVKRETGGLILLTAKSSDRVLDYLREQRIEPMVVDGMVTLSLQPNRR